MPEVPLKVSLVELQLPWNFLSCCGFRNEEGKKEWNQSMQNLFEVRHGFKGLN
jgi:hypothetical protein